MVRAGSKQRNRVAINKNFPRWTSVGNLLSNRPIGVISSNVVNARTYVVDSLTRYRDAGMGRTSTSIDIARCTLMEAGGSNARDRTSSMEEPSLTFIILIRNAKSDKLKRIISGRGWSTIFKLLSVIIQHIGIRSLPGYHVGPL